MNYKQSGVDVEAGYKAVNLMKKYVDETHGKNVLTGLGGFGGIFSIADAKEMQEPVLVSGTDGVGTKLKIAFLMNRNDTVGIDCAAMCLNDIVCCGARPLFFLDYIACGKILPEKIAQIVKGISEGCKMADTALIGGETAEMPGFYPENEYDLAGFAVGIADKAKIINGSTIKAGDTVVGIASSGVHSNGFSLIRQIFRPSALNIGEYIGLIGCELGHELLKPTKIYVKPVLDLIKRINIKGISHITGGGFIENIPRIIPKGLCARINIGSWDVLPVFKLIQESGDVDFMDMLNTFNMGIGMVMVVDKNDAPEVVRTLYSMSEKAYIIGDIISSEEGNGICFV